VNDGFLLDSVIVIDHFNGIAAATACGWWRATARTSLPENSISS
jgi:hypothetical protein